MCILGDKNNGFDTELYYFAINIRLTSRLVIIPPFRKYYRLPGPLFHYMLKLLIDSLSQLFIISNGTLYLEISNGIFYKDSYIPDIYPIISSHMTDPPVP